MKKILPMIFLVLLIVLGISLLIFVLRMTWFPPTSMGMMMGKDMMFHHMYFWFSQVFIICTLSFALIFLVWKLVNKNKSKR
ncbi:MULTISPECIES: hypothetical protein [Bacillaceae]|uniref:hypothetical protein n=1 Tax=Bacillaceae TaxID=186817 RepID=UPI002FFEEA7A